MRRLLLMLAALLGAALLLDSARADVWDFKAGAGPVYGTTFRSSEKDGVGLQAYVELGLTETLSLTAGGGYALHTLWGGRGYWLANAGMGMIYAIDVLTAVPFVSLRLGFLGRGSTEEGGSLTAGLGASAALGFDYLFTDSFTLGLALEYQGMLSDWDLLPAYLAITGRVGFRLPH